MSREKGRNDMIYESVSIPEGSFPIILAFPELREIMATFVPDEGAVIEWEERGRIQEFSVRRVTHRGQPGGLLVPVLHLAPYAEVLDS